MRKIKFESIYSKEQKGIDTGIIHDSLYHIVKVEQGGLSGCFFDEELYLEENSKYLYIHKDCIINDNLMETE